MDDAYENEKRSKFKKLLEELGESETLLSSDVKKESIYHQIEDIYWQPKSDIQHKCFKHFYSDIFAVISKIHKDPDKSVEFLGVNLKTLREDYQSINKDIDGESIDIKEQLRKLYDHVSLDIARINYSDGLQEETTKKIDLQEVILGISSLNSDVSKFNDDLNGAKKGIDDSKKEYISILGIFAAVVLAFTAGITFSTSVLENIHKASPYRMIIIVLLIGLVLVNILFGLFYYIDTIVNGKQSSNISPIVIANSIFLLLLALTLSFWWDFSIEKRDKNLEAYVNSSAVVKPYDEKLFTLLVE
ncbi:MAG: hypothetical protein RR198_05095 [Oscillospiraceae bacterium]